MIVRLLGAMLLLALSLVGCTSSAQVETPEEEVDMSNSLTWQEAKASSQATELEIAAVIPEDKVVSVEQKETGMLLSCDKTQHSWNGWTRVTVVDGADIELLVKDIEAHYRGSSFEVSVDRAVDGAYRVQLLSADGSESYLVAEDVTPGSIHIASSSACFTLPDDVYPGGNF